MPWAVSLSPPRDDKGSRQGRTRPPEALRAGLRLSIVSPFGSKIRDNQCATRRGSGTGVTFPLSLRPSLGDHQWYYVVCLKRLLTFPHPDAVDHVGPHPSDLMKSGAHGYHRLDRKSGACTTRWRQVNRRESNTRPAAQAQRGCDNQDTFKVSLQYPEFIPTRDRRWANGSCVGGECGSQRRSRHDFIHGSYFFSPAQRDVKMNW